MMTVTWDASVTISNQADVTSTSAYVQSPISTRLNALAGVVINGVNILNVNSLNQVDPFYPTGNLPAEGADQCLLSHPAGNGEFHYHIASGCMVNPSPGNLTNCSPEINCLNNIALYSIQTFFILKTLTVIGFTGYIRFQYLQCNVLRFN